MVTQILAVGCECTRPTVEGTQYSFPGARAATLPGNAVGDLETANLGATLPASVPDRSIDRSMVSTFLGELRTTFEAVVDDRHSCVEGASFILIVEGTHYINKASTSISLLTRFPLRRRLP